MTQILNILTEEKSKKKSNNVIFLVATFFLYKIS